MVFFFFQAEDGIRDGRVTGVQTCALPISQRDGSRRPGQARRSLGARHLRPDAGTNRPCGRCRRATQEGGRPRAVLPRPVLPPRSRCGNAGQARRGCGGLSWLPHAREQPGRSRARREATPRGAGPRGRGASMRAAWLGLALIAGAARAQEGPASPIRKRTAYEDLQMFSQVLNQIRVNHPDSIDTHDLFMAAVTGMVHAADPHSYVLPATRLAPEKETAMRAGKLYPVPITFAFYGGSPVVVSVAPGSEAATLDILPGDELIARDSHPVQAESAEELDISLAGPKEIGRASCRERV